MNRSVSATPYIPMLWSFLSKLLSSLRNPLPRELPPITDGEIEGAELVRLLGREDPVILDVGCNDGSHTIWLLSLFARASVYSFEPDPRAVKAFRRAVLNERAKLFELVIAGRDGEAEFHASDGLPDPKLAEQLPEGWHQSGSLHRPRKHLEIISVVPVRAHFRRADAPSGRLVRGRRRRPHRPDLG